MSSLKTLTDLRHPALDTLVENRRCFATSQAELNIYDTQQYAEWVSLRFDAPVLTSMVTGKKVMHLEGEPAFEFFPGQSLVMPAGGPMYIDFPEATAENPTRCLALALSGDLIRETLVLLNEFYPRAETGETWEMDHPNFHFSNDEGLYQTLLRLVSLFREEHPARELFTRQMLRELIVRLLQTQAREMLVERAAQKATSHRLAWAVEYVRSHLHETLSVEQISEQACMSAPHFYRSFKNELGLTPMEFVTQERLRKAKQLLCDPDRSVSEIGMEVGYSNVSYFSRVFKQQEGVSPTEFRSKK
ncbi:AraC-type DNA-binding protein [Catalinimonas alkaloidigena]|uniref:AraC-type DNA-binding protein n=1 Tax=Catalinimonas alkaloidigena TaxID=1075417 RepID=A0A1G9UR52_9BACT|nr:AraC family transcriptional regulator [Catalinimonas alkaloidigena]SDM62313.1 AraC-type DNA-binding protein [Catalinimonas alkaloidigena]